MKRVSEIMFRRNTSRRCTLSSRLKSSFLNTRKWKEILSGSKRRRV